MEIDKTFQLMFSAVLYSVASFENVLILFTSVFFFKYHSIFKPEQKIWHVFSQYKITCERFFHHLTWLDEVQFYKALEQKDCWQSATVRLLSFLIYILSDFKILPKLIIFSIFQQGFFLVGLWSQLADKVTIHSIPCSWIL